MFVGLIFLRERFTSESWTVWGEKYASVPLFAMCFADWCPHCTRALPDWTRFESEMSDVPDVVVGSVNCSSESALCDDVLKIRSYPTFLVRWLRDPVAVRFRPAFAAYLSVMDRLRHLRNGTFLRRVVGPPTVFPTVVFQLNSSDTEGRDLAILVAASQDILHNDTFLLDLRESQVERRVLVYLEKDFSIAMDAEYNSENISSFITEHQHALLGEWGFRSIRELRRMFAVVFSDDDADVRRFRGIAMKYQEKLAWGSRIVNPNAPLRAFKVAQNEFPVVVIIDIHGERYHKLTKVTNIEKLEATLRQFDEDPASIPFEALDIQSEFGSIWTELIRTTALVFLIAFSSMVAIVVLAWIGYMCWSRRRAPKHD
jgi:thiol-disulfide isomerase/thioredoxin